MKTIKVNWDGNIVKLTWMPGFELEQSSNVTSVHAVCIKDGLVLLPYIQHRGFNFPGGHVDKGEHVEEALLRVIHEEAYVKGRLTYLGVIQVSHEENTGFPPNSQYPLIGYQAFYRMDVEQCFPFLREHESMTRIWVEPDEVPYVLNDHELTHLILEEALRKC